MAKRVYSNDENRKLGIWLTTRVDGNKILNQAKNPKELEDLVYAYAKSKGSVAGMEYVKKTDETDEGLNWVTFSDLFNELNLVVSKLKTVPI